ncbi:MAG TPA: hypothetical protein DCG49_08970, partial [Ruminococcus sp.]|nr:hypothetical protein [Ruminococcus sp.]
MHSFFKRISAALCAGMLTAACLPPLPATADKADYKPAPSISADFHPSGEDAVAISIPSKEHVDVLISRQNASGEDEILYRSNELQAYHNCLYYPLEPGEYDLSVSMEAIKYAPQKRTYTEHISIPEPDGFSHTEFRYQLSVKKAENTDEGIPEIVSQDEGILDQIKYTEADLAFKRYDMIQGDYDGNGAITVNDAQLTLNAFLTNMTGDPDGEIPNPGQLAACDIDGNGELMASDAQWILLYYLELLLETDPKWPYSTYTDEKTMLIAVGAYHEDEHAVGISWIGTQWMDKVDVLISPDGNAYTVAATVQDDTKYSYPVDDDFASAYFKVSYTDEDGETIESAPFFVDAKNDGITVEYPDTDGDGLSDILEEMLQTDPAKKDTDADGLDDAQELKLTNTDPTKSDSFKAGIPDSDADCDDDGLTNLEEVTRGTNPLQADTDADGLSDRAEIFEHKTDPLLADTDGDGLEDGFEIRYGLDPLHASTDGTPDADRQITQTFESQSDALKSVNSDESPYALSVEITTNGDAEKEMAVSESSYSAFLESDAQIGDIIDLSLSDFLHTEKIHLSFAIKDECLDNTLNKYSEYDDMQGIKRLSIFKYYDEISMMLPVETQYDLENNVISADVTEAGTYCVIDLEVWFDLFDLEPEEIDAAIAAQNQPAESVTQSIQGGTNAVQQVYTVPKAINPVQLYTDTNPYTHRNEYPVDLVFILQTSGPEMADVIYEYELDVLEEVVGYVFRNYSNVRVHVVHYDADKAEAVRFGSLTYCTNATAFSRGIRALSYTTDDNYCPTKPAFQTATHDLQLRNSVNTYFYHMHNGNNLYTLDYDGIVMSESNYG